jgi:hypothetical protein
MHLNTSPAGPPRKPCLRDMAQLTSPTGLLPAAVVPLMSPKQLKRRIREINVTHPQYQEETPLVWAYERKRRQRLRGKLQVTANQAHQVA